MNSKKTVLHLTTILIIVFIFPVSSFAQITFERSYGGTKSEVCFSAHQTLDGGYIIVGSTESYGAGKNDVYLIKTKANGDTLWTRTYGGKDHDGGSSVQQTSDGGYIITGGTSSFGVGEGDVYLIKAKANGDTLWTRTYGGKDHDGGSFVQQTSDGGYIITGQMFAFSREDFDVCLIKTDSNGHTIWTRTYTYGVENNNAGLSVQQTSDGGYIIAGFTQSPPLQDSDVYLIKTDANGDTIWTRTYGGKDHDGGRSAHQTSDGGYIITGGTSSFGVGEGDVYLIKTKANGDTIRTRTYGGKDHDGGSSVQQTSDGGYIIAGHTMSFGAGDRDMYLIKTDTTGLIAR